MIQQHGGNIFRYSDILDFSANINPLGMTENIRLAIERSAKDAEKYPDPFCTELREKIALHENTVPERIVCGNGADDLIFRAVHALKPKKALVCQPTFSEYSRALSETDCKITEYPLSESEEFELNQDFIQSLSPDLDMCILCTPNNPTGKLIQPEILSQISERCRENGIILMCDECFMGFVKNSAKYSIVNFMNKNSIVLKAFTKIFAVPGIRLGYAVCGDTETACKLSESGQFWSVSSVAQAVGITALDEKKISAAARIKLSQSCSVFSEKRVCRSRTTSGSCIHSSISGASFIASGLSFTGNCPPSFSFVLFHSVRQIFQAAGHAAPSPAGEPRRSRAS